MSQEFLAVFKTRRVFKPVRCKIDFDSDGEEAFYVREKFFGFLGRWVKRFKNFREWFDRREELNPLDNSYEVDTGKLVYFFDIDIRDALADTRGGFANSEQEILLDVARAQADSATSKYFALQDHMFLAANRDAALDSVKRDIEFSKSISLFNPSVKKDDKKKNVDRSG